MTRLYLIVTCMLLAAAPVFAQTRPADADVGRALALRACSGCHVVANGQAQPAVDGVPSFAAISRRPDATEYRLRVFLSAPHGAMPDIGLTAREIDDVTAYILGMPRQ